MNAVYLSVGLQDIGFGLKMNIREALRGLADAVAPFGEIITNNTDESTRDFLDFCVRHKLEIPKSPTTRTNDSLEVERIRAINHPSLVAGVFIGGHDGMGDDYTLFKHVHPEAPVFAVMSTGGTTEEIFDQETYDEDTDFDLRADIVYDLLFTRLLHALLEQA